MNLWQLLDRFEEGDIDTEVESEHLFTCTADQRIGTDSGFNKSINTAHCCSKYIKEQEGSL